MTTMTKPNQIWSTMPGWGIVADLTPPELIESRRLNVLRKIIGAALALLVVILAAVYAFAYLGNSSASDALSAEQSRTSSLIASQSQYSNVTRIQAKLTQIDGQLKTVMGSDVDMQPLVASLRAALPNTMSLKNIVLSLTPATANSAAASGLNMSGHQVVGSVTLSGDARSLAGVSAYVDALGALPGVEVVRPGLRAYPRGVR